MATDPRQKRDARIGLAAIAVLVFAFFAIFFLADIRKAFISTDGLHVLMPSAAGLRPGSLVWIAGQTVGEVQDIEVRGPESDSLNRVLVHIRVESRHLEHIRHDSQARVTSFSVIGDPVLDIIPGSATAPPVEEGDTLRMRTTGTSAAAIARARAIQANLRELLTNSTGLMTRTRQSVAQAAAMREGLGRAAREMKEFIFLVQEGPLNTLSDPEFNRIISDLGRTISQLQVSFARASERASAARSDAAPALKRLAARADTIAGEIKKLQTAIQASGGGLLVRAQTDTAIVKALHRAQEQLDSLIAETKRNPLRFWF